MKPWTFIPWVGHSIYRFFTALAFLNMANLLEKENPAHDRQILLQNSKEKLTQLDEVQSELAEINSLFRPQNR